MEAYIVKFKNSKGPTSWKVVESTYRPFHKGKDVNSEDCRKRIDSLRQLYNRKMIRKQNTGAEGESIPEILQEAFGKEEKMLVNQLVESSQGK